MNDQQIREIAKAAFQDHFGDIDVVSVNIRRGVDFEEDPIPVVDVNVIYDGKYEQLSGAGLLDVDMEISNKVWRDADSPCWPLVRYIPKSEIGRRDPATVFSGPAPYVKTQADSIREFVIERYVVPFLSSGRRQLVVRSGDVAKEMGLEGRVPNICSVLGGDKFLVEAGRRCREQQLRLVCSGSAPSGQSTTMTYRYELEKGE